MSAEAVVLFSGGLDSMVCAEMAGAKYGSSKVLALNLVYGQKHRRETVAAEELAERMGLQYMHRELPAELFQGWGSALMGESAMPKGAYGDPGDGFGAAYVPFRNGVFISIASAVALSVGAQAVYYGAHAHRLKDGSLIWAYPDCAPLFTNALNKAIRVGTQRKVSLIAPLQFLEKSDIVRLALQFESPIEFSWSCYNGGEKHCGLCPTCVERIDAFKANHVVDPVEYAINVNWELGE